MSNIASKLINVQRLYTISHYIETFMEYKTCQITLF